MAYLRRNEGDEWKLEILLRIFAKIEHLPGLGYHSLRRRFANDLKTTNLRDLFGLGGWKSPQTVLTIHQQPELAVMWEALNGQAKRCIAGGT